MTPEPFDPLEILATLERHRVAFVLVGRLAAVIHGAGGIADEVAICPQVKDANLERLARALSELGVDSVLTLAADVEQAAEGPAAARFQTPVGVVALEPRPAGTRGWDDLRRRAPREPLGKGVRATVAAADDLVRIAAALDAPEQRAQLETLRRVAELEKGRGVGR